MFNYRYNYSDHTATYKTFLIIFGTKVWSVIIDKKEEESNYNSIESEEKYYK